MDLASGSVHPTVVDNGGRDSPLTFAPNNESEEWLTGWHNTQARDLVDQPLVSIDSEMTVDAACEMLLLRNVACLAIKNSEADASRPFIGLFDYADVNSFLVFAATQHALSEEILRENLKLDAIVQAAKGGNVPVKLVSNLSEKNPLEVLDDTATIIDLLRVFSSGIHRVLIQSTNSSNPDERFLGFVSDMYLLSFFHSYSQTSFAPGLNHFLSNPLHSLALPSLSLRADVKSCSANSTVLDAMQVMSENGVSSVAVTQVEDDIGSSSVVLLSAVSVTDVGKVVVPSQGREILHATLQQFVSQIREPLGSSDGEERCPVFSASAASTLRYTVEKLLSTNSHRVFITEDPRSPEPQSPMTSTPPSTSPIHSSIYGPQLRGVISVVDVLALFAQLAGLSDVDSSRMQKHRRASSASSLNATQSPGQSPRLNIAHPTPIQGR